jgi:nicotinamide-nucleotide amidase
MRVAVVAVGSELLGTDRLDTNSLKITALARRYGGEVRRKSVIGDDEGELASELLFLLGRIELVVVSGGLGPTQDDLTRQAAARAFQCPLVLREDVLESIEAKFASFGRRMPEVNRRQAEVLEGARVLDNARGTAPGLRVDKDGTSFFFLPGVPSELEGLLDTAVEPWLAERAGHEVEETAVVKVACLPESSVEQRILPLYDEVGRERIAVLAKPSEITVRVTARGEEEARRLWLRKTQERIAGLIGDAVFAFDEATSLELVVGELLRRDRSTLATAESCTGGMVATRLTDVPGSSDYFVGGVVCYSNELKTSLVGVPEELLEQHGAVSEAVARALARGVKERMGSHYAVGITGVAGPGGGSDDKPVGTVHIAVADRRGRTYHRVVRFPGHRDRVRRHSSQLALEMVRRLLLGLPAGDGE